MAPATATRIVIERVAMTAGAKVWAAAGVVARARATTRTTTTVVAMARVGVLSARSHRLRYCSMVLVVVM